MAPCCFGYESERKEGKKDELISFFFLMFFEELSGEKAARDGFALLRC